MNNHLLYLSGRSRTSGFTCWASTWRKDACKYWDSCQQTTSWWEESEVFKKPIWILYFTTTGSLWFKLLSSFSLFYLFVIWGCWAENEQPEEATWTFYGNFIDKTRSIDNSRYESWLFSSCGYLQSLNWQQSWMFSDSDCFTSLSRLI